MVSQYQELLCLRLYGTINAIQLMGSGIGSVPFNRLLKAIESVLQASVPGGFEIATTARSLV